MMSFQALLFFESSPQSSQLGGDCSVESWFCKIWEPLRDSARKYLEACKTDTCHFELEETERGFTMLCEDEAQMRDVEFCQIICGHDHPILITTRALDTEFF